MYEKYQNLINTLKLEYLLQCVFIIINISRKTYSTKIVKPNENIEILSCLFDSKENDTIKVLAFVVECKGGQKNIITMDDNLVEFIIPLVNEKQKLGKLKYIDTIQKTTFSVNIVYLRNEMYSCRNNKNCVWIINDIKIFFHDIKYFSNVFSYMNQLKLKGADDIINDLYSEKNTLRREIESFEYNKKNLEDDLINVNEKISMNKNKLIKIENQIQNS